MEAYDNANLLKGKVALVTGASSGIGASICRSLVLLGVKTVGVARNIQPVELMKNELKQQSGNLLPYACDITIDEDVERLFETIKKDFGGVDICINNAGMSYSTSLLDGTPDEWRNMMNLNVVALCLCTKLSIKSMLERDVEDGHIINIGSVAGYILNTPPAIHFYTASKHAVRAVSEGFRQELRERKSHIRMSAVSPGYVATDFLTRMYNSEEKGQEVLSQQINLTADDVAKIVLHVLNSPPHVEINDVIVRPVEQII